MKDVALRTLLVAAFCTPAPQSVAWEMDGYLIVSSSKAESFSAAISSFLEAHVTRLEIVTRIKEEGSVVQSGSDDCTRVLFQTLVCSANAIDITVTNGCEYCAIATSWGYTNIVLLGTEDWSDPCQVYDPGSLPGL